MKKIVHSLAIFLVLLTACHTAKTISSSPKNNPNPQEVVIDAQLPDLEVRPQPAAADKVSENELPKYNATTTKINNLLHTKLEVRPEWATKHLTGKATLTFKPWFKPTDSLQLDAKNLTIKSITLKDKPLQYAYDNLNLRIKLDKTYNKNEEYVVVVEYISKPDDRASFGGSAAITSDKGLYFINPTGAEGSSKPRQLWTQGETESNSFWFPTIDKPYEKTTQEIYITVEDQYKTLSNGLLISSKKNVDGTRTDYWKMDKPHAPYLFMMAIGEYSIVQEKWENIDLLYYVEPKFETDAKAIFPYTPEILSFFSSITGLKYPWPKLAQVVVRDYVSGAMENTTAIIYGEYVQNRKKALVDVEVNELVVAHEVFHHWFGDYVTCESWSNLTLNEGFANYSEYLWLEHKYGKDIADFHRIEELQGYVQSSYGGMHDLIDYRYDEKEQMFDAHSYNKGGLVLHMLRRYLGDETFFAALKLYLNQHAYTDVEAHELRMAFEEVSGEDLNWFFNQWFFKSGHPKLNVSHTYNAQTGKVELTIKQTQSGEKNQPEIFDLPLKVDLYTEKGVQPIRQLLRLNKRSQSFTIETGQAPVWVNIDGDNDLLAEIDQDMDNNLAIFIYNHASGVKDRLAAINTLSSDRSEKVQKLFEKALGDSLWAIRNAALPYCAQNVKSLNWDKIAQMAINDPRAQVRYTALQLLGETKDKKYAAVYETAIQNYKSSLETAEALGALIKCDPDAATQKVKNLETTEDEEIIVQICQLYHSNHPDPKNLEFMERSMKKMDSNNVVPVAMSYAKVLSTGDLSTQEQGIAKLKSMAMNAQSSLSSRVAGMFGLQQLSNDLKEKKGKEKDATKLSSIEVAIAAVGKAVEEIKMNEKSEDLRELYRSQGF